MDRRLLIPLTLLALLIGLAVLRSTGEDAALAPVPTGQPSPSATDSARPPSSAAPRRRAAPRAASRPRPASPAERRSDPGGGGIPSVPDLAADSPAAEEPTPEPVLHTPDAEGIAEAIRSILPDVRSCYESWLEVNPELAGQLTLQFVILPRTDEDSASTSSVGLLEDELQHELFTGCVANSFGQLQWELSEDGAPISVTYPLRFRSDQEDEP